MRLIVNADDFGYSRGQNFGILDSFANGIVRSASLMAVGSAAEHAAELACSTPSLGVGVHLVLDAGQPLLSPGEVASLVGKDGLFRRLDLTQTLSIDLEQAEQEWQAQVQWVLDHGIAPTHLDSHHHVHFHAQLWPLACKLAREFDLPLRIPPLEIELAPDMLSELATVKHPDCCLTGFHAQGVKEEFFTGLFHHYPQLRGKTVEVMCHPAYVDDVLLSQSSYNMPRVRELQILKSRQVLDWVRQDNVQLSNYSVV